VPEGEDIDSFIKKVRINNKILLLPKDAIIEDGTFTPKQIIHNNECNIGLNIIHEGDCPSFNYGKNPRTKIHYVRLNE